MKIRDYTPSDTDALIDAWYKASAVAHPFLSAAFVASEDQNIRNLYLPNTRTWVAEVSGKVVGFIAVIESEPAEVGAIFLDPAHHGKGIGKALMDLVISRYGTVELDVFEANKVGRAFYARYGFKEITEGFHEASGNKTLRLCYTE